MKAAIINPYLDTLGGGERYTVSFAKVLADLGWNVDLEWEDPAILPELENRFGMDLSKINIVPDVKRGDGYDLCFWVSDGSIPLLRSRKNILHFQVPFHDVKGDTLMNKMKLFRINKVVCNSNFTKKVIDNEYHIDSLVIYPPIDVALIKPKRKENIILFVGRFSELKQDKHQDILVKNFRKLFDSGLTDWKLILAGGIEVGVGEGLEKIKKMSEGYPIEIIESPSFNVLKDLYGRTKIFWSAVGFGEDENRSPEKVEHFGMNIVESMAGAAVPVIYNAGGYKEIIKNGENGFLWDSESELLKITTKLIKDGKELREISHVATRDSVMFSYANFETNIKKLL
jgi:glycosyltransferase involved in cell wall biosynthesis